MKVRPRSSSRARSTAATRLGAGLTSAALVAGMLVGVSIVAAAPARAAVCVSGVELTADTVCDLPDGVKDILISAWGAGGAGGRANDPQPGGAGGAGALVSGVFFADESSLGSLRVKVGKGGINPATTWSDGTAGGGGLTIVGYAEDDTDTPLGITNRKMIVAGGGGGGGAASWDAPGGAGGNGGADGARGSSNSAAGHGGKAGVDGVGGQGGAAGADTSTLAAPGLAGAGVANTGGGAFSDYGTGAGGEGRYDAFTDIPARSLCATSCTASGNGGDGYGGGGGGGQGGWNSGGQFMPAAGGGGGGNFVSTDFRRGAPVTATRADSGGAAGTSQAAPGDGAGGGAKFEWVLPPTGLQVVPGNAKVDVSWTASTPPAGSGFGAVEYEVFVDGVSKGTTSSTSLTVTGLVNKQSASLYVKAKVTATGHTAPLTAETASTSFTPDDTTPVAPDITGITSGSQSLTVAFSAGAGGAAATGFEYRYRDSTTQTFGDWTSTGTGSTSPAQFAISGLTNGHTYVVEVRALNSAGSSPADSSSGQAGLSCDNGAPVTGETTCTLPEGVEHLHVQAEGAGGAGGRAWFDQKSADGGNGGKVRGIFDITGSTNVHVKAGEGGVNTSDVFFDGAASGGGATRVTKGGSGGQLLAVAGGGGGGGEAPPLVVGPGGANGGGGRGGDAGADGADANNRPTGGKGGKRGADGAGGQGGAGGSTTLGAPGTSGVAGTATTGGSGIWYNPLLASDDPRFSLCNCPSSGGGGDGYGGGGSGGQGAGIDNGAGGGGGGGNFTAAAIGTPAIGTVTGSGGAGGSRKLEGNRVRETRPEPGKDGSAQLIWVTPPQIQVEPGNAEASVSWGPVKTAEGLGIDTFSYEVFANGQSKGTTSGTKKVITGLVNDQQYNITVAVTASGGEAAGPMRSRSQAATVTPKLLPSAPTITGVTPNDHQLTVAYTASSPNGTTITGYQYRYREQNGATWSTWTATGAGLTSPASFTVTGLTNGKTYEVAVRAVSGQGDGPSATETGIPAGPPLQPQIAAAYGNQRLTIKVEVDDNGSPITEYQYRVKQGAGGTYGSWNPVQLSDVVDGKFRITGLQNGISYFVRVQARNAIGWSPDSNETFGTPMQLPGVPTLTAVPKSGEIEASFTPGDDNGATNLVHQYRYRLSTADWPSSGTQGWTTVPAQNPFTISGLASGSTYVVQARTRSDQGSSSEVEKTVSVAVPPTKPVITTVTPGDEKLTVAFTPASDNGAVITGYKYMVKRSQDATWPALWVTPSPAVLLSPMVITTVDGTAPLVNGTAYDVKLVAANQAGNGQASDPASGTPISAPDAPALELTPGNGALSVAFTPGAANGSGALVQQYRYRKAGDNWPSGGTEGWTTVPGQSPFSITGLTDGAQYVVQARTTSDHGTSSITQRIATPASPPAKPVVQVTAGSQELVVNVSVGGNGGAPIAKYEYAIADGNGQFGGWIELQPGQPDGNGNFTITGLTNGQAYSVKVRASNSAGWSPESDASTPTAPIGVAATPTIKYQANGDGTLTFRLTPDTTGGGTISGYRYSVKLGSGSFGNWVSLATSQLTADGDFTITGLTNGMSYEVKAAATNGVGWSSDSHPTAFGIPAAKPQPPTNLTLTGANKKLTGSFTPGASGGVQIVGYQYQITTDQNTPGAWLTLSLPLSANNLVITTTDGTNRVVNGTDYHVRIRAKNAINDSWSEPSSWASATPAGPPERPVLQLLQGIDHAVKVTLGTSGNGGSAVSAMQYQVTTNAENWGAWRNVTLPMTDNTFTIGTTDGTTPLVNGTTYYVRAQAKNSVSPDWSQPSRPLSVIPATAPSAPLITQAIGSDKKLSVVFTAGASNGASNIRYQYTFDSGTTWNDAPLVAGRLSITGLVNDQAYNLQIRAVSDQGVSSASGLISGLPRRIPEQLSGPCPNASCVGATITAGIDLRGLNLSGFDFTDAVLADVDLSGADLRGAIFVRATMSRTKLVDANLSQAKMNNANLTFADLTNATVLGTVLVNADLSSAILTGVDMSQAIRAKGGKGGLRVVKAANLSGVNLSGARLTRANLRGVRLVGANLRGVKATGAVFDFADLRRAKLDKASLQRSSFTHSRVAKADFTRADLKRADFTGAKRLDRATFRNAKTTRSKGLVSRGSVR